MKFFKSISDKIKNAEEKFIQSKVLIIILPVILVLILILFSGPLLLNNKQLKEGLEAKFADQLKAELKINGEIKISLFPSPNITFNDIYIRNLFTGSKTIHLHSKKINVELSILSALLSNFDIRTITAHNTVMEVSSSDSKQKPKTNRLIKLISKSQLNISKQKGIGGNIFFIDDLNFSDSKLLKKINFNLKNFDLIYYSKLENKRQIDRINVQTKFKKNSLYAQGNFVNQENLTNFSIKLNSSSTNKESLIFLQSNIMELSAKGKFSSNNNEDFFENFSGNMAAKIFNLKGFYKSFISNNSYIFKKLRDTSDPITISSSVTKQGPEIAIKDCEIQSQNIIGVSNIDISYIDKMPIIDLDLNLGFVDFDKLFVEKSHQAANKQSTKEQKNQKEKGGKIDKNPNKIGGEIAKISQDLRDFDLNLELKVEKAKYLFEEINEISLYSSISKNGEILILPLKFKTPGNGDFRITGIFENRNDTPRFLGKLDATGESLSMLLSWLNLKLDNLKYGNLNGYTIYSDLFQKSGSTHFDNLYINIKDGPEILGESSIYHQSAPYSISKLDVSGLDISKFVQTASKNTYLSPGSLLKKLLWVNALNSRNDLEISIDDLKYNDTIYNTNPFKLRIGQGYFEIDNLKIESQDSNLTTSLAIQIKESISKFNLSLKSDKLNIQNNQQEIKFKKDEEANKFSFIDTLFSLPSFEGFSGNVILDFKDTQINNIKLANSKIEAQINNGIVKFNKFRSSYGNGGRVNFSGSASVKFDKSVSGNLTLTKFPIEDTLKSFYGLDRIKGVANISSSISSIGSKKTEFISNLSLKAKYNTSSVTIEKYGLDSLIKKMFNFQRYKDEINDPKDIIYSDLESTKLKNSSGSITIDRKTENTFRSSFKGAAFNGTLLTKFSNQSKTAQGSSKIIFLTGNKKRQIPITIASNFQGQISNLEFTDNFSQAQSYIDRAKKFYSKSRNKNRSLLKTKSKKKKQESKKIDKTRIIPNPESQLSPQEILQIMNRAATQEQQQMR